ncbi:MAG: cold shock domain-containing protein [Rhizomicrobium sp.]
MDDALAKATALFAEVTDRVREIETEQDARLQLINRILVEVLGWDYADIKTEPHSPSGFTDYLLSATGQKRLVVEAKRIGTILVDTFNPRFASYKVGGKAIASAIDGVEQAAKYCFDHGVNCAVVTTGVAWIVFMPFPGAGVSFREGHAFVFPNFTAILDEFAAFFDLLSKSGAASRLYTLRFARAAGLSIAEFEPLVVANRNEDARLIAPSPLAADLDPVFREFFGAMSADNNLEMLIDCFVETRESRFADASLEKLVRTVTTSIEELGPATDNLLAKEILTAVESGTGEAIVIVGNAGAGKSTFMERFFASVLEPTLRSRCLVIKIDLKKWSGDIGALQGWLTLKAKATIEQLLYGATGPNYDALMGLYFSEYQRWSQGHFKPLYDSNKDAFKIKFGEFLHEQLDKNPYDYVLRMLSDVVHNRKLLPCLIFDNTDALASLKVQESVFQFSQAIRENIPFTFAIVPITDTSFWRLSKAGPFQSYKSKMFYLPVPSAKAVLEKRVAYLKRKVDESVDKKAYFLTRGIKLSVDNINAFAACVEEVFLQEDFAARRVSWLANNNVQTTLAITHRVIISPYFSIDDLVKAYIAGGAQMHVQLEHRKMMHALVLGNHNHFQPEENPYILNVFEISPHYPTSPLLLLSVLKVLIDRAGDEAGIGNYMSVDQVRQYFDSTGVTEAAINYGLSVLLARRLLQPYDASNETLETSDRIAITHAGRIHYDMALNDPIYLTDMAYATPARSTEFVDRLRGIRSEGKMGAGAWREVQKLFANYCVAEDTIFMRLPADELYNGQRQLRADLRGRWIDDTIAQGAKGDERTSRQPGYSQVPATIKWFNPAKGYGFVEAGLEEDAFLHGTILKLAEIDHVSEGDSITCDIAVGAQGRLQVIAVYSLQRSQGSTVQTSTAQQQVDGHVEFYNSHKGYGFIKADLLPEDVYVSARVLDQSGIKNLVQDQAVRVKIESGRLGKGYMATSVEII